MKTKRPWLRVLFLDFGAISSTMLLLIPFVVLTALGCFSAMYFFFQESLLASSLYAAFAAFVSVILPLTAAKLRRADADIESYLKPSRAQTPEARRSEAKVKREQLRNELTVERIRENRIEFYQKAVNVIVYLVAYATVLYSFFGVYPAEAFYIPWQALIALWVVLLLFLPKGMVTFFLLVLTILSGVIAATGFETILRILPMMVTLPLFMVMNFAMLFGPLMFFNIQQIQVVRPGEGSWGDVTLDTIRGQEEAKRQILTALRIFLADESEETLIREKGIFMVGPPGVGKTLTAKAIAAHLGCPIVLTTGSAFTSTFIGVGIIIMIYLKWKVEGLASKSRTKRCVLFIDEAEQILRRREGMMDGQSGSNADDVSIYGCFSYDQFGQVGDMVIDSPETLRRAWAHKFPIPTSHPIFAGAGMGGGGNMALPVYLNWMDGVPVPPMMERIWRSKVNLLLDVLLFVPPFVVIPSWRLLGKLAGKKVMLRVTPAKAKENLVLHLAATNMPQMVDPAMLRPKRFGLTVHFTRPDEAARADIADLYLGQAKEKSALHPELDSPEMALAFAKVAIGLSPAQIMQVVFGAVAAQRAHVVKLMELQEQIAAGEELEPREKRYWDRYQATIGTPDWDRSWATWESLMESLRTVRYGIAAPTKTSGKHRETTAVHEFAGHLLTLWYFAKDFHRPTALSIMPRGQTLGMVAHTPVEDHEPQPQQFLEGLLRVMVGSVAAERLFYGNSQPGVVSDLQSATRLAVSMVSLYGMVPRACEESERLRYLAVGQSLLSLGAVQMNGMGGKDVVAQTLELPVPNPKLEAVYLFLGQAFVDSYRLILKNKELVPPVVATLLEFDEIMGKELEDLWEGLANKVQPLTLSDTYLWPDELIHPANPFYVVEVQEA